MTKVAVFCEGETEQLFCQRLFDEVIGTRCQVQLEKLHGKAGNRFMEKRYQGELEGQEYLIRIFDCSGGGGETVISDIHELYDKFINEHNYTFLIGIRDIFPLPRDRINALRENAQRLIPTNPVPGKAATVVHVFSIMEIEAWFLAEHEHFDKISPALTLERIRGEMRFDPSIDDMQLRNHPKQDLKNIYELAGTSYHIERTIGLLNMNRIYLELPERYPPLKELTCAIDQIYAAGANP